ncbi:uncharacterized protein LOC133183267 [Saccostrea echinata]|uniref:uncharacterized protein LOC133183267 n=1 Tax=Saccostrea echinata TaxID=191078 RepID=UPI002A7F5408|nr:uncharacterized protein LOC133183267 [Saccostrea echinata]
MMSLRKRENTCEFTKLIGKLSESIMKEMVLAHSSYARAAGIQSEINKVTVTRVAGSEVEYQRQMNLHRKNMEFVIRNIRKEQTKLKRSIEKYSTKLRDGKREREKREREERIRDQKSLENMSKVSAIFVLRETPVLPSIRKRDSETDNISPDSGIGDSEDGRPLEKEDKRENISEVSVKRKERTDLQLPSHGVPLPSIMEGNELGEDNEDESEGQKDIKEDYNLPEISVNNDFETKLNNHLRTIKPKKQGVSFSDLIKLQHSTNTKKLFNLVNILAQKHGLKDVDDKQEKENRNSSILRGSTDESISLKAASVLYPMKYGYDSGTESEMSIPMIETDRQSLFEGTVDQQESNRDPSSANIIQRLANSPEKSEFSLSPVRVREPSVLSPSGKQKKRNKSLPMLMDEAQTLKFTHSLSVSDEPKRGLSLVKSPKPRILPPIQKQKSEETYLTRSQRSNSISWTEAFGLLKGVHSIID